MPVLFHQMRVWDNSAFRHCLWKEGASEKNPAPRPLAYLPSSPCPYWLLKEGTKANVEFGSSMFLHRGCVPGEAEKQGGKCTHKLTDECMDLYSVARGSVSFLSLRLISGFAPVSHEFVSGRYLE